MCCVGKMLRKARARLEVVGSNPMNLARVYYTMLENHVTCDSCACIFLR